MASSALARQQVQLAKTEANARATRRVDKYKAKLDAANRRIREIKLSKRASQTTGAGLAAGGGVISGQVARMQLFVTDEGVSRAPWVNYGAGAAAVVTLMSGRAKSNQTMALVAVGVGMGIGQLAIDSYTKWDLVPGDMFGT